MKSPSVIRAAKEGDERAVAAVVEEYLPAALAVVRGLYVNGLDDDDIMQEARIALLHAIAYCDPTMPFVGLARAVVRRRILDLMTTANRQSRNVNNRHPGPVHTEDGGVLDVIDVLVDERSDPADAVIARAELARLATVRLSALERLGVMGVASGRSYDEICEANEGLGYKQLDNAVQRGRRKLAERLAA